MKRFKGVLCAIAPVAGLAMVPGMAFAQSGVSFDPAPVLAIISSAEAFVVSVGLAVLTFLMVAKGIKWARRAG